jgi:CubicO group peptidase (beta-lactamase class C family)
MLERNVPSVAVAVARDGRIVWEEGFGWADRERRIPATPHTTYSIASVSKPFTATGLMVLQTTRPARS